jgi:hypothetical protein
MEGLRTDGSPYLTKSGRNSMSLVTIADLEKLSDADLQGYLQWAGDLRGMYENFIENDHESVSYESGWGAARNRSFGIHASEISSECLRPAFYSLTRTERRERVKPFWKKRFRAGHAFHAMIQDDLRRMCEQSGGMLTFESEVRVNPKTSEFCKQYDIFSACDGIIGFHDQPGDPPIMRICLEIKTESDGQFKELKEPRGYHREQAHLYMKTLDIPVVFYFYINKSNSVIAPSDIPYIEVFDKKVWGQVLAKIINAHERANSGNLPDRTEGIKCEFCGFSYKCKPNYLKRKEAMEASRLKRDKAKQRNPNKGLRLT